MASEDHLVLANNIKTVHKQLREKVMKGEDVEEVWKTHVENIEVLNKYAKSMEELATKHWLNQENSRIWWIFKQIENYFWLGGIDSEHLKDVKIAKKKGEIIEIPENVGITEAERIKVLDVGSCYNPFGAYHDRLDVLPIDIAPANSEVFKCDFLQVEIGESSVRENTTFSSLEKESFGVIIFCLLLEYLPAPHQRWLCVQKAVQLLREDGLLCIVTPDSSHMGRNSQQLKSWKQGLSLLGLSKVSYEKSQHFHGLVYRKPRKLLQHLISEDTEKIVGRDRKDLFYIPQDFSTTIEEVCDKVELTEEEREIIKDSFFELPDL
eukprot:TRINITY_DN3218_c0_g1_i1.p1 TRINITY_DN3218_c0_g1~~TRINITY_DN3218_c0_g1_i1.p1  ORF type:complete len:322 (+),score=69.99 TRINITY_DN3218_c0_g1_i1:52-1017(+)